MIIKTNVILKNLGGETLKVGEKDLTLGEALSNILVSDESGGKMKLFVLAKKLYENKSVDVDVSDLGILKNAVNATKIYTALVSGQVALILEELKDLPKKDK